MKLEKILDKDLEIFNIVLSASDEIKNKWEYVIYEANETICEYGEVCKYFYVVVSGFVNIYHTSEKGKTYSQSVYEKGSYIGELEIFTDKPFICGVEAMTTTEIIRLKKDVFLKWVKGNNDILYYLMKTLASSTYKLSEKASYDTLYCLKFRVCEYLIECMENENYYKNYKIFLNKKYLSEKFVVTTRSINRTLKELFDREIIEIDGDYIKIKNFKKLIEEKEKARYL
ncbi:Crp/Fnr family transcriptional regulator [Paramaledivibacter caminithermalis]|uniref:cAMP-binding domain of CRP or a regulatory subunit of cAMP-dependent protein kinases n=1 Tax=Paramaledivibacter caminithermalis (strain DSM 15212 / CIP 107654 / DViRD3) TaxID=1121301 RepID=A0A1M6RBM8_PARC5|nr:Crp/Fnr family transcriptional regulator [Paramaledivibacter caminithermalis]SHK29748.1 cAMP-binding domain of CRP or a regulatory subunit of cAMP-dependent protein kinases [Paramaledivibacter caminithermalis DSM 15212]